MARIRNVFLDRDGTIIKDKHYLADPAGVELLPGAAQGLRRLAEAGMRLFEVTNQSGIGRGMFDEAQYLACRAAMVRQLTDSGVTLDGTAFCPHAPERDCSCRKPATGMWERLAADFGLCAGETAMVGDKLIDAEFGRRAGMALTVLVLTGKGKSEAVKAGLPVPGDGRPFVEVPRDFASPAFTADAVAHDLAGAAAYILAANRG